MSKATKLDPNQFEFDWIILHLVKEPTLLQIEHVRQIVAWPMPKNWEDVDKLRNLAVRLHHLDMTYDERRVSINQELAEARVLLGQREWALHHKFWTRLANRDSLRFLKLILIAKKENGLI